MDKLAAYSSEESDIEEELNIDQKPENNQDSHSKKRKLPSLPLDVQHKFIKKPALPDPAFYDMNRVVNPGKFPGLISIFPFLEIRPTPIQYDTLQAIFLDSKLCLKLPGQKVQFSSLLTNELDIPSSLHVTLHDATYHTKQQQTLYNKSLGIELQKLKNRGQFSNLLTFDRVKMVPSLNQSHFFLVMELTQNSKDGLKDVYDLIKQIAKENSDDGIPKFMTDDKISTFDELHTSIARCFPLDPKTGKFLGDQIYTPDSKILKQFNELLELVEIDQDLNFSYDKVTTLQNNKETTSYKIGD